MCSGAEVIRDHNDVGVGKVDHESHADPAEEVLLSHIRYTTRVSKRKKMEM